MLALRNGDVEGLDLVDDLLQLGHVLEVPLVTLHCEGDVHQLKRPVAGSKLIKEVVAVPDSVLYFLPHVHFEFIDGVYRRERWHLLD